MSKSPKSGPELVDLLAEKDEMIQVLTGRLEEIAEQYDRLQRMGNSRAVSGSGSGGGGTTTEALSQKLDDILGLFPETHPGDQLQRIEDRIESMMKMLEGAPRAVRSSVDSSPPAKPASAPQPPASPAAAPKKESGEDFWEAAKARLMGGGSTPPDAKPSESVTPTFSQAAPQPAVAPAEIERAVEVLDEVRPPAPIGPDASAAELIAGLDERDRYITYMISRARHAETAHLPDWNALAEVPSEQKAALDEAQAKLEKHLRESEISISLERAALARERSKLFQIKQQLEKQVLRLGKSTVAEAPPEAKPEISAEAQADQRWLRMFSSGKKKDS